MAISRKKIALLLAIAATLFATSIALVLAYRDLNERRSVIITNNNTVLPIPFVTAMEVPTGYMACGNDELGVRFAVPDEGRCDTIYYRYQSNLPKSKSGHEPITGISVVIPVSTDESASFSIFFYDGSDGFNGRINPDDLLGTAQVDASPEDRDEWEVSVDRWRMDESGYDLNIVLTRRLDAWEKYEDTVRLVEAAGGLPNDIVVYAIAYMNGDGRDRAEHLKVRAVMEQVIKSIETR